MVYACPLAAYADTNANGGNESEPGLLVLIAPSQASSSAGDAFNISYLVLNLANYSIMNLSLTIEGNGPVDLNVSALLPGQSAGGVESIDKDMNGPLVRRARAQADDPVGNRIVAENSTSIDL